MYITTFCGVKTYTIVDEEKGENMFRGFYITESV